MDQTNSRRRRTNTRIKTCYKKTRELVCKLVDSIYFNLLILIFSIFSLFNNDIRILCLPTSVDMVFVHLNEAVFFLFLLDLILCTLFKPGFFASFNFYLDLIALMSIIPDVSLIWLVITTSLVEEEHQNSENLNSIFSNTYLSKASGASQVGSK